MAYSVKPFILKDPIGFLTTTYSATSSEISSESPGGRSTVSTDRVDHPGHSGFIIGDVHFPVKQGTSNVEWKNVWNPAGHAENVRRIKRGENVQASALSANTVATLSLAALFAYAVIDLPDDYVAKKNAQKMEQQYNANPQAKFCHLNIFNDSAGNKVFVMNSEYSFKKSDSRLPIGTYSYKELIEKEERWWMTEDDLRCDFKYPNSYIAIPEAVIDQKGTSGVISGHFIRTTIENANLLYHDNKGEILYVVQFNPQDSNNTQLIYDIRGDGQDINLKKSAFHNGYQHIRYD